MENLREKKQEKIDGKFYDMSPAADYRHSLVNGNIFYRLRGQFQDSLCAIFMENLDFCYCEDSEDYVIPDIMIICDRKNLKKGTYRGIPKFIVETLSPSTAFRDRTKKKEIYESCGGRGILDRILSGKSRGNLLSGRKWQLQSERCVCTG